MNPNITGRTQEAGEPEAKKRLEQARRFLGAAAAIRPSIPTDIDYNNACASLAITAGIAAMDAACIITLGKYNKDSHQAAVGLSRQIQPNGPKMSKKLKHLLDLKNDVQYGMQNISYQKLTGILDRAEDLVEFADDLV